MRIWDIHPGYLNRQSLLGEHRELHGMVSIFMHGKTGYSHHPETLRWVGYGWALQMRHRLLRCEMELRGYQDRSPVALDDNPGSWPAKYVDPPGLQLQILRRKYIDKEAGRIPLPQNAQQLWSQHKYSVLARNPQIYHRIGLELAEEKIEMVELTLQVVELLKSGPSKGGTRNAAQHMWGYVREAWTDEGEVENWSTKRLLLQTQKLAVKTCQPYLLASTALSELLAWETEEDRGKF